MLNSISFLRVVINYYIKYQLGSQLRVSGESERRSRYLFDIPDWRSRRWVEYRLLWRVYLNNFLL